MIANITVSIAPRIVPSISWPRMKPPTTWSRSAMICSVLSRFFAGTIPRKLSLMFSASSSMYAARTGTTMTVARIDAVESRTANVFDAVSRAFVWMNVPICCGIVVRYGRSSTGIRCTSGLFGSCITCTKCCTIPGTDLTAFCTSETSGGTSSCAIVGAAIAQLLVPPLVSDVQNAVKSVPGIVQHFVQVMQDPNNPLVQRIPVEDRPYLTTIPQQIGTFIQTNALDTASKTFAVLLSTASILATVIVVPVLAAYMLLDAENIKESFLGIVPAKNRLKTEQIIADLDHVVGGFIRGQLIDGTILGAMLTVMLAIMHVPYALLIGVVS